MSNSARNSLTAKEKEFIQAKEKEILEQTTAFINATNLQSMEGVQRSILDAIKNLDATGNLYQDPSGKYCYLQEDVLNAIKSGYDNYNMAYEELTKSMNPTNEKQEHIAKQLEVITEGMDGTGLSQGQIDEEITKLQEETKNAILKETAAARAKPLPASEPTSTVPSRITTRRGSVSNGNALSFNPSNFATPNQYGSVTLPPRGGMYRPKKHKKSRKHPK